MIALHPIVKQVVCVVIVALLDQGIKEVSRIAAQRCTGSAPNDGAPPPPNDGTGAPTPIPEEDCNPYGEEYPTQGC